MHNFVLAFDNFKLKSHVFLVHGSRNVATLKKVRIINFVEEPDNSALKHEALTDCLKLFRCHAEVPQNMPPNFIEFLAKNLLVLI